MKREREWIDVLDEVYGLTVTFPAELSVHAQRLLEVLGVTVVVKPPAEADPA